MERVDQPPSLPPRPPDGHKGLFGRIVSDAKAGLGGLVHLPAAALHDVETFGGALTGQDWGNADIKQQPGESMYIRIRPCERQCCCVLLIRPAPTT